jgi:exopolysaccharide biosynthesis protein
MSARAATELGAWVPLFKGVDHAVGTNTANNGGFSQLQVVHIIRVDLADPDIQLFASPRMADYQVNSQETYGHTVSAFLLTNQLQVAINANEFYPVDTYQDDGTAMDAAGLIVSRGEVVSPQDSDIDCAAILFTTNNEAKMVFTNWPATSTEGIYTAVSGTYPILVNGVNISYDYLNDSATIHRTQPRTAFGLSADRRYLFLMTIDGRQSGYSVGAYDYQTAAWLMLAGAADGINMDGGGSTTLVVEDSVGNANRLNNPSTIPDSGKERTVGGHFGVYAKPVPGFINDIKAIPSDTSAAISWTTTNTATTKVEYGLSTDLGIASEEQADLTTNHTVKLTGLTTDTGYYFRVVSDTATEQHASAIMYFKTEFYVTTNLLFDLTNAWTYTTANLDGVKWMAKAYDDSSWLGSGPGLLYVDLKPLNAVSPKNTEMPANGNYPFYTYYFRSHFQFSDSLTGVSLVFSNYIDDGAVFYLNGVEINRLRFSAAPSLISNSTMAESYPCEGNATCADLFTISGDLMTNLVSGDNVLAVEVHNYNGQSQDITFGAALFYLKPYSPGDTTQITLKLAYVNGQLTLTWEGGGYTLQQTENLTGSWTDVTGVSNNSYTVTANEGGPRFYRLRD